MPTCVWCKNDMPHKEYSGLNVEFYTTHLGQPCCGAKCKQSYNLKFDTDGAKG